MRRRVIAWGGHEIPRREDLLRQACLVRRTFERMRQQEDSTLCDALYLAITSPYFRAPLPKRLAQLEAGGVEAAELCPLIVRVSFFAFSQHREELLEAGEARLSQRMAQILELLDRTPNSTDLGQVHRVQQITRRFRDRPRIRSMPPDDRVMAPP